MASVIIPSSLLPNPERIIKALENALTGAALAAQVDFYVTTETWKTQPKFKIAVKRLRRTVSTDNVIYGYVNDGTVPHVIMPRVKAALAFSTPFVAKTVPHVIASRTGGRGGDTHFAKIVHHPGSAAREFDEVIHDKWEKKLLDLCQRSIDSEVDHD